MRTRIVSASLWLTVSILFAAPGVAQEYSDTTSVVVVEVPVNVTTRDGDPITGLTADDFEILDQGKKQVISGFDVIDLRQEESRQELAGTSPAARRHFVFVFDLSFSEPSAVARARKAALDVVRSSLHPGDLIGVATYSTRQGPQLVLNFTTDRRMVEQALSTLGLSRTGRPAIDPLESVVRATSLSASVDDLGAERGEESSGGGGFAGGLAPDEEIEELVSMMEGESQKADLRARVDNFSSTFGFLADLLAPLDGRKHVVFLSEGFDASALFGTADQERLTEIQQSVEFGQIWDVDTDERFGSGDALAGINEVLDSFRRADATIHSIDIGRLTAESASPANRGRQDGLFLLARETSGEFYRNFNDLSDAMGEMLESTSVTYVLAFQPSNLQADDDDFRRLKVRLKDAPRGAKLSYRQGYYPPAAFSGMSEAQRQMRAAQDMLRGVSSDGPAATVLATPMAGPGERAYVPVLLEIAAGEIGRRPLGERLPLEIYAYAVDSEGEVADHIAESLLFDVAQVRGQLESSGLKFFGHLDLAPGEYALRVMVRDGRTGGTSIDVLPLVVPDFAVTELAVLPPLVPEGTEQWVLARETVDEGAPAVDYPFMFKGQSFVPAVRPVFQPEQVVALSLVAATRSGRGRLEVGALVLAEDGTPMPGTFLRVLEREQDESAGLERLIAAFEVPNLPSGSYELVVTMSDPATGDVESGSLEFVLGPQAAEKSAFMAPAWMPDLSEIVRQLGPEAGERVIRKIDKEAVRSSYESVLVQLSEGRQMGAILELAKLEGSSVSDRNPMGTLNQIAKVQQDVLDGVTSRDPELLLPIILLHKEAYSQYRLRQEPFLAVQARNTTLELVEQYAKRSDRPDARRLASRILTSMAAEVYSSGAHISARTMFEQAIRLDKTNGVAKLGLGFMLEGMGQGDQKTPRYEDVVEVLEEAVAVDPALHEARLRLAVNLGRVGRDVEAGQHLQLLIDRDDVPDWLSSLAYQELARLYMKKNAWQSAKKVLERGREKLPGESKLALQLAYVYERCGEPYHAAQAAEAATGDSLSARFLYLKVPRLLEQAGMAWTEMATARLPALSKALGRSGTGVGR
ncbi:MAG: VWA domain-containing protein [Thermoanaerobaculia bacterium]|nr:VWA domain-containing protein [Thermoanaerobaculia bacterium]